MTKIFYKFSIFRKTNIQFFFAEVKGFLSALGVTEIYIYIHIDRFIFLWIQNRVVLSTVVAHELKHGSIPPTKQNLAWLDLLRIVQLGRNETEYRLSRSEPTATCRVVREVNIRSISYLSLGSYCQYPTLLGRLNVGNKMKTRTELQQETLEKKIVYEI